MSHKIKVYSTSHFSASRLLLLIIFVVSFSSCNKDQGQNSEQYRSVEAVSNFLKEQYFEVPDSPTSIGDFEYTVLNGEKERFSSNRGSVILLNFWATWCYPCQKEMPDMQKLANELKGEHFRMLAINYAEHSDKVNRFIQKFHYTFDVVMDKNKAISTKLKVKGLPTTMVIDKKGRILGTLVGPANWSKEAFLEFFKALSRKQS